MCNYHGIIQCASLLFKLFNLHVDLIITGLQFSLVIMGVVLSVVWVWSYFVTPFENFAYAPAPILFVTVYFSKSCSCIGSQK